jgi:GTP-binding protein
MDADRQMREWLEHHDRPYLVVATKIDKLNARERSSGLAAIRKELNGRELVLFSAPEGRGVREIWHTITNSTTT